MISKINQLGLALLLLSTQSCKYYQYHPDTGKDRYNYQEFKTANWRYVDRGHVLVLHLPMDTVEFYDPIYDEDKQELIGPVRPFEGLPLHHYNRALNSDRKNLRRPFYGVDGPATNQIHIHVDDYVKLDSTMVKFSWQEVQRIDFMEQSGWNTIINLTMAPVTYVMVAVGIYTILWISWENERD